MGKTCGFIAGWGDEKTQQRTRRRPPPARLANRLIGAAVAAYAFLDDLLLGPVLVAVAVWFPWYFTWGLAAGLFTFINVACCNWVQRSWDSWIHGQGAKLEAKLESGGGVACCGIRSAGSRETPTFGPTIAVGLIVLISHLSR